LAVAGPRLAALSATVTVSLPPCPNCRRALNFQCQNLRHAWAAAPPGNCESKVNLESRSPLRAIQVGGRGCPGPRPGPWPGHCLGAAAGPSLLGYYMMSRDLKHDSDRPLCHGQPGGGLQRQLCQPDSETPAAASTVAPTRRDGWDSTARGQQMFKFLRCRLFFKSGPLPWHPQRPGLHRGLA
jgi:hypothetical protein